MSDHWGTPPQQPEPGPHGQPEILTNRDPGRCRLRPRRRTAPDAVRAPRSGTRPTWAAPATSSGPPGTASGARPRASCLAAGVGVVAVAGIGVGAAYAAGAIGQRRHASRTRWCRPPRSATSRSTWTPRSARRSTRCASCASSPRLKASLGSTDDIRKWAFEQATKDDADLSDLSYDRDVKPWIGDRFGFAVMPGAAGAGPERASSSSRSPTRARPRPA